MTRVVFGEKKMLHSSISCYETGWPCLAANWLGRLHCHWKIKNMLGHVVEWVKTPCQVGGVTTRNIATVTSVQGDFDSSRYRILDDLLQDIINHV